jgi:hypothetical protein
MVDQSACADGIARFQAHVQRRARSHNFPGLFMIGG